MAPLGPLIEMLAAGNRVVIKPSEYTPACADLLREMVHSTFDRDRVDVVVGGLDLARAFTRVRWDHLLYTGSPAIGREIAKAAAEQLVPVTLELGGKCPAILTEDSVDAESVKQVLATKALKNGQMCISVDYCLVPRGRVEEFARLAADYVRESMPGYCESDSCTGIISSRHVVRIQGLLDDARARGCDVRALEEVKEVDPDARQLPMSLVVDPPDDLALMQEEIFGPILPIKAYDTVGGIGQSGSGRHHGIEGFREFSNLRAVFVRGEGDLIEAFAPPYGPAAQAVADAAFAGGA